MDPARLVKRSPSKPSDAAIAQTARIARSQRRGRGRRLMGFRGASELAPNSHLGEPPRHRPSARRSPEVWPRVLDRPRSSRFAEVSAGTGSEPPTRSPAAGVHCDDPISEREDDHLAVGLGKVRWRVRELRGVAFEK